jgi:hypothetical protein
MATASAENRQNLRSTKHPLLLLPEEDLELVSQFVLASGSLKEMALLYQVSYPTIRASLDRVIANLHGAISGKPPDPMTDLLADLVERGEIKVATAKSIRAVYRKALETRIETRTETEETR